VRQFFPGLSTYALSDIKVVDLINKGNACWMDLD